MAKKSAREVKGAIKRKGKYVGGAYEMLCTSMTWSLRAIGCCEFEWQDQD